MLWFFQSDYKRLLCDWIFVMVMDVCCIHSFRWHHFILQYSRLSISSKMVMPRVNYRFYHILWIFILEYIWKLHWFNFPYLKYIKKTKNYFSRFIFVSINKYQFFKTALLERQNVWRWIDIICIYTFMKLNCAQNENRKSLIFIFVHLSIRCFECIGNRP